MKLIYAIGSLFLLLACAGQKEVIRHDEDADKLKKVGLEELLTEVHAHDFKYEHLKIKANANYKDAEGNKTQFRIILRAQKDSIIHIGISKAGIQAVKAVITVDSLKMVNMIDKNYMLGSFQEVQKMLPLNIALADVEHLIMGNLLPSLDSNELQAGVIEGDYFLSNVNLKKWKRIYEKGKATDDWIFMYKIDPENFKIKELVVYLPNKGIHISAQYADFQKDEDSGQMYAQQVSLSIDEGVKNTSLSLKISKLESGKQQRFPFDIPEKYTLIQKNEQN